MIHDGQAAETITVGLVLKIHHISSRLMMAKNEIELGDAARVFNIMSLTPADDLFFFVPWIFGKSGLLHRFKEQ